MVIIESSHEIICPRCKHNATVRRASPGLNGNHAIEWTLACHSCGHEWEEAIVVTSDKFGSASRLKAA